MDASSINFSLKPDIFLLFNAKIEKLIRPNIYNAKLHVEYL